MSNPLFVRSYQDENGLGRLDMHSGYTIKGEIAEAFVTERVGTGKQNELAYAPFWIIEGFLWGHELDENKTPSLAYYLEQRVSKDLQERWDLYTEIFDANEGIFVLNAYNKTRRHVMETEAELSPEQKKSA